MSTQKPPSGKTANAASPASASSAQGHATAAQRRLEEIQLASLGARLRDLANTRDLVRALGEDPDRYASQLAKQYSDLALKRREPSALVARSLPPLLAISLDRLSDIFNWWQSVIAPNATVGLTQKPTSANTGGVGIGADIFRGQLALGGEIWSSGAQEQWWVNTWQYIVPFPATPSTPNPGSLSYRFNVPASLAFYRQDVVAGSVHVYATVATTSNLSTHPIDFNQHVSSDFAIIANLPASGVPPILGGVAKVTGAIPLSPGGTPAIGIIIGLIISVVNGDLLILPGEFSNIDLVPPDATSPSDLGKVEYRRDQPFWLEAVAKMIAP